MLVIICFYAYIALSGKYLNQGTIKLKRISFWVSVPTKTKLNNLLWTENSKAYLTKAI
jgi:hypothetical protein